VEVVFSLCVIERNNALVDADATELHVKKQRSQLHIA
jgi:hypothetical protein